ncbi:UNVERIFIED_CONTAM: hypothetical protein FKN15_011405 [Acipenser sinensis]
MGFEYLEIKNYEQYPNPTKMILENWERTSTQATVGKLLEMLTAVERVDVISDLQGPIEEDCKKYLKKQLQEQPVQVPKVDSCVPKTLEMNGITINDDPTGKCSEPAVCAKDPGNEQDR